MQGRCHGHQTSHTIALTSALTRDWCSAARIDLAFAVIRERAVINLVSVVDRTRTSEGGTFLVTLIVSVARGCTRPR